MSILQVNFSVPLWLLIFVCVCAAPLWIKWYKYLYRNVIKKDDFYDSEDSVIEQEVSVFQKAKNHWNANEKLNRREAAVRNLSSYGKTNPNLKVDVTSKSKKGQPYVKAVLKILAASGDTGMLIQSIADKLGLKSIDVKSSLDYLEKNNFVEPIVISNGTKYYLTHRGKKYCVKRGYGIR